MTWNPQPPPFGGRLVVVGGQCRKIGKTALVVDLIRAFDDLEWTAVKISPHCESGCPVNGPGCSCSLDEHVFGIREERDDKGSTDTSRFLAAGARLAIWLETKEGRLAVALPALTAAIGRAPHVIIESNAVVEFWRADLFLMVIDPSQPDFKKSAQSAVASVDGFVFRSPFGNAAVVYPSLNDVPETGKFVQLAGQALPDDLRVFSRQRIVAPRHPTQAADGEGSAFSS